MDRNSFTGMPDGAPDAPRGAAPESPAAPVLDSPGPASDLVPPGIPTRRPAPPGPPLARPEDVRALSLNPDQRLLVLDSWRRSGLPAADFASLVGISTHTLYGWKRRFDAEGPAGLSGQPRGAPPGSRLSEPVRRAILMMKDSNPDWGVQKISDMLLRGPGFAASPGAVARVLHDIGYVRVEEPTRAHEPPVREFERARPGDLWQTDLFTFTLKRENRRVYLVAFMDDHSRFVTGWGLHATASTALVLEVFRAAVTNFGPPKEVLTDNGAQYVVWRGKSAFARECERLGIRQIVARPRHPQTLGKIERFWGSLWRECLQSAIFTGLDDARARIGHFVDHYNFQRPHQGVDGAVPADRYFAAAPQVRATLAARVAENALDLARHGEPREEFYVTGRAGGKPFTLFAEGERFFLIGEDGSRTEVDIPRKGNGHE